MTDVLPAPGRPKARRHLTHHGEHPSVDERRAAGKAARARVPRSSLGEWSPGSSRPDALELILAQNAIRAHELVPIRHGRMAASPWTYLRGAAAVMASDLAQSPNTGLEVQLCGDAHALNFGLWATPERNLSFDLRDFDETHPGPFEWDVKRLVASLVVVARENALGDELGIEAARSAARAYRLRMARYAEMSVMDIWYDHIYSDDLKAYFSPEQLAHMDRTIERKRGKRTSLGAFGKLTAVVDGRRRIVDDPPLLTHPLPDSDREVVVADVLASYRASLPHDRRVLLDRFTWVDTARKVVGVGSVGMRAHLVLLAGRDGDDPLFLQVKQAGASVLESHLRRSTFRNHGQRVVCGQRLIQSASDIFLGWTRYGEIDFYVRQFRDWKIIPESTTLQAGVIDRFATACGEVLARAHARTGDPIAISAYLGSGETFEKAAASFAPRYADQTERDHAELVAAIDSGEVAAEPGW